VRFVPSIPRACAAHVLRTALLVAVLAAAPAAAFAATFQVSSPAFNDGDVLPLTFAFDGIGIDNTQCGGQAQSPPLIWTGAPDGTKSFAVVVFDPDGFNGLGVAHWVMYGIPPTVSALPQGAGSVATLPYVNGMQGYGKPGFRGFCPPKGQSLHHYVMTVYALDLAPDALAPGLTRDALLAAFKGHVLRASSIVGRFGRS
jgi:Raf kinase inhibitor-like YbhB/YbcL family protein